MAVISNEMRELADDLASYKSCCVSNHLWEIPRLLGMTVTAFGSMFAPVLKQDHRKSHRDFKIVDETDDYLVVDKPPLLLTHPTKPNGAPTLWKELRELLAFEIANNGQVSIVNRLDRETSGLVLVAKTST